MIEDAICTRSWIEIYGTVTGVVVFSTGSLGIWLVHVQQSAAMRLPMSPCYIATRLGILLVSGISVRCSAESLANISCKVTTSKPY